MNWLKAIATWVLSSGGAGVLGFWVIDHIRWCAGYPSEVKRNLAFIATGAIAAIVWVVTTWAFREPFPGAPQDWFIQIVGVMGMAITASQVTHGRVVLHAQDKAAQVARETCMCDYDDAPEM